MGANSIVGIPEASATLQRSLLPNEFFIRIGCVGCDISAFTGYYRATGDRHARDGLKSELCAASEVSAVPVDFSTSAQRFRNSVPNNCNSGGSCIRPEVEEMFLGVFTDYQSGE